MEVKAKKELIEGILTYSKDAYPKEIILLLRGKIDDSIEIGEVIVPPFAVHGSNFSLFNPNMVPFDLSVLGVVHSHPSGVLSPSLYDLNHFYGRIMVIAAFPYDSVEDIAIFNKTGNRVPFEILT